ncbi:MAG: hypothetical protein LC779_15785, partial [Actinobacteria bacterium]|nr:hypothetical protein [Actinomycetota bacterium]
MSNISAAPVPEVGARRADERKPRTGVTSRGKKVDESGRSSRRAGPLVRVVLLVIVLLWILPTLGLLISSFRSADAVRTSGWWTVFASPLDFTQWTLQNYRDVLS